MKRGDFWFMVGSGLLLMVLAAAASGGFDATVPGSAQASSHTADLTLAPYSFDVDSLRYRVSNLGRARVRNAIQIEYRWLNANNTPVGEVCRGQYGLPVIPDTDSRWREPGGSAVIEEVDWAGQGGCLFQNVPAAARKLRIKLNSGRLTTELNYNNNEITVDRPFPDLVVDNATLNDEELRYRVRNVGTARIQNAIQIEYRWLDRNNNPVTQPCRTTGGLPVLPTGDDQAWHRPGGSSTITEPDWGFLGSCVFGARLGSWRALQIKLNPGRLTTESNYENNTTTALRPLPDLTISNASFPSRTRLTFTIAQTEIVARGDILVRFNWTDRSGNRVGQGLGLELDRPARNGDRSVTVDSNDHDRLRTFISAPPSTAPFLNITLDPGDEINETADSNNTRQVARPLPDLAIENLRWSGVSVAFTVRNRTDVPVTPTAQSKIRLEWHNGAGALVGAVLDLSLPVQAARANGAMNFGPYVAGSSVNSWLAAPPAGATALWVMVDPLESFAEISRSNNRNLIGRR